MVYIPSSNLSGKEKSAAAIIAREAVARRRLSYSASCRVMATVRKEGRASEEKENSSLALPP